MADQISEPVIHSDENGNAQKELDDLFKKRLQRKAEIEGLGHKITKVVLVIIVSILALIGVIRMSFLILPACSRWLNDAEIAKIDEFFIHGTVGALVVEFLRDKMSNKEHRKH